jgi:hypothetical protein
MELMTGSVSRMMLVCAALTALVPGPVAGNDADAGAPIEVRRLDGEHAGWLVAETANFRIYHRQHADLARKAARAAEKTRSAMLKKWFDKATQDWSPRCDVYLHTSDTEYAERTGISAGAQPGFSSVALDSGRVVSRRIDLNAANDGMLNAVLPHEVAHIAIWSWFGQRDFPQWVNEGMAVLTEPRDRVERHLRNLPRHRQRGELSPISQLVESKDYPERHLLGPFYAQSVSLVDFLTDAKGPATFTRFVRDGLRRGYESACQRHYGWSLEELEEHWWRHVFGTEEVETAR